MYSESGLGVDVVLELTEREVDDESGAEDTNGILSIDVVLEIPAMDDNGADDSSLVGEEVVILGVVSRLEEVMEYDLDVESVAMGEDEIDDAVPEGISRVDEDRDDKTLTVEKVEKVVPIEVDCSTASVDVGRDTIDIDDDDLEFNAEVKMPDADSDVISESSKEEDDGGDDVSLAFTEVEKVVIADVEAVSAPPEATEEMVVDEPMLEDVMLYLDVGVEGIPILDIPPELPPCKEEPDPGPATDEDLPGPKDGVGTAASPESAVDIESEADSDGTVVAPDDSVRCGISSGKHADGRGVDVEYNCADQTGVVSSLCNPASKLMSTSILAELSTKISVLSPLVLELHAPFASALRVLEYFIANSL